MWIQIIKTLFVATENTLKQEYLIIITIER